MGNSWKLKAKEKFFVSRGGTLFAVIMPEKTPKQALILGSHTDSPSLKLKHNPVEHSGEKTLLLIDPYGAPQLETYFDRDLYIAGRVYIENKGKITEKLIGSPSDSFSIPSLAIHLHDKEHSQLSKQTHLRALYSLKKENPLPKNTLGHDLFLVPSEKPSILRNNCISGYRIDNLASAYGTLEGFVQMKPRKDTALILALFNHEEFGSTSDEGAASPLLSHLCDRIFPSNSYIENSLILSVDNAHAIHPNYPDKYDAHNAPVLGKGIAIKHNANHKYATSGKSTALLSLVAKNKKIPLQHYEHHSDGRSGSTIGCIASANFGIQTVDIGLPQLGMHSIRELISMSDIKDLIRLTKALCGSFS